MEESTDHAGSPPVPQLDLPLRGRGKVRDLYNWSDPSGGPERLVIVATDRISAFDVVLPTPIPGKGIVLTQMAAWWLEWIERRAIARTHLLSSDVADLDPSAYGHDADRRLSLEGRVMIARACRVIPVECVVRGYLEGSGWREYERTGGVCGIALPRGLRRCERLPEPIFTPATKADRGTHDENIPFDRACELVGAGVMERVRALSLAIYDRASSWARDRGIIIADTKFEFGYELRSADAGADGAGGTGGGVGGGEPVLIDEALTPDSSRFWPSETYKPGQPQPSFDKQFVREHLESLMRAGRWSAAPPGPELPGEVVRGTAERYRKAFEALTET